MCKTQTSQKIEKSTWYIKKFEGKVKKSYSTEEIIYFKIIYVKNGLLVNRLNGFETNILEQTISNKKWFIMFAHRPPIKSKLTSFNEVSSTLNKVVNKYDNILVAVDLNIDFSNSKMDTNNYLSDFFFNFFFQKQVYTKYTINCNNWNKQIYVKKHTN